MKPSSKNRWEAVCRRAEAIKEYEENFLAFSFYMCKNKECNEMTIIGREYYDQLERRDDFDIFTCPFCGIKDIIPHPMNLKVYSNLEEREEEKQKEIERGRAMGFAMYLIR